MSIGLDLHYVLAYTFGKYFVDKDTGAPLAAGVINFFVDQARTIPFNVFTITGSPPNYTYISIGSTVTLDSTGMPQYLGTNIPIYFYPYDANGNFQLYYYEVLSAGGILQFTREGQPNVASQNSPSSGSANQNFVPNPQFLLHNNLPANNQVVPPIVAGQVTEAVTILAPGGWTFERPDASNAVQNITFPEFTSFITTPDGNPRFAVRIVNSTPDSIDTFGDLRWKLQDVNKFESDNLTFTYSFEATSNLGGVQSVQLWLIKNYGTPNGSPSSESLLTTFNITAGFSQYLESFSFGTNTGETFGDNLDDNVQLALRANPTVLSDITYDNFVLDEGTFVSSQFPATTDEQMLSASLIPPVPNQNTYNGWDLYLPRVRTLAGDAYDNSAIGHVEFDSGLPTLNYNLSTGLHNTSNLVMNIGQQFETISYSPLGIPMARLQQFYFDTVINTPIYGTGLSYFTIFYPSQIGNQLILTNNSPGAVTNTADSGTIPTAFTFATIHTGNATLNINTYAVKSYIVDSQPTTATFWIESLNYLQFPPPSVPDVTAGTSGFTVGSIQHFFDEDALDVNKIDFVTVNAVPAAGTYFTFGAVSPSNIALKWQPWFKVNGSGVAPAPVAGYTLIEIDLLSTDTQAIVAEKIRESLNGWQVTTIVIPALPPTGSWFTAFSISPTGSTFQYVVWYSINNTGVQPSVVGTTLYIKVSLTGTESPAQIAQKTQIAINSTYYAVPDYRDAFLRGWNNGKITNQDVSQRWSLVPGVLGDMVGTFQNSDNLDHTHNGGAGHEISSGTGTPSTAQWRTDHIQDYRDHHFESRPINYFVNLVTRY